MKDIVCGIMTSRTTGNRREWIEKTWGAHFEHVYYSDHRNPLRNVVKVSNATHYKSNEEKHINFLNRCGPFLAGRYEWIFCCDDDTFVFPQRLRKFVREEADPGRVYGTVHSAEKGAGDNPIFQRVDRSLRFPAGGAGYLISSAVMKRLHPLKNHGTGYSDVSLGLNLMEKQIPLMDFEHRFFAHTPSGFQHPEEGVPEAISYHYIKTRESVDALSRGLEPTPTHGEMFRLPLSWWW